MSHGACRTSSLRSVGALLLLTAVYPHLAGAQASPAAQQRLHLQAFGTASYVGSDFHTSGKNGGGTIGVDLDGFRLLRDTSLGLDVRYTASKGTVSNQYLLSGGPRISFNAYRFQPYVTYQAGYGRGTFNHGLDPHYLSDTTGVRAYGGGFDYMLTRFWGVRADVLQQRWRYSHTQPYFHPVAASVGISYQLHLYSRAGPD